MTNFTMGSWGSVCRSRARWEPFQGKDFRDVLLRVDHAGGDEVDGLLKLLPGAGDAADELDLLEHRPVHGEGDLRVHGVADHDNGAPGAHPVQAGGQGIPGPDHFKGQVEAPLGGGLHVGLPLGVVAVKVGVEDPQFPGPLGFHVADLGQGRVGGPRLLGQLPDELADDAGAHHQHPVVEADPRLAHGVVGHHQGVDASGGHVGDSVRQPVGVGGLSHELLGIGPVAHEADVVGAVDLPAELLLASLAHVALAAVEVGPEGHPVPHGEGAVPGVGDHAAELVA